MFENASLWSYLHGTGGRCGGRRDSPDNGVPDGGSHGRGRHGGYILAATREPAQLKVKNFIRLVHQK
jgi:hypothetical protein